jgi:hypothetical protein
MLGGLDVNDVEVGLGNWEFGIDLGVNGIEVMDYLGVEIDIGATSPRFGHFHLRFLVRDSITHATTSNLLYPDRDLPIFIKEIKKKG